MAGLQAVLQHKVYGVLQACQASSGQIVQVMYMYFVGKYIGPGFVGQQVVVYMLLAALAGYLHHHAGRSVGIHVGVFARDIVLFCRYYVGYDLVACTVACLGALVAVQNVGFGHSGLAVSHEFALYDVLYLFDRDHVAAPRHHLFGDGTRQAGVVYCRAAASRAYGLADALSVKSDTAPVSLSYYHKRLYYK